MDAALHQSQLAPAIQAEPTPILEHRRNVKAALSEAEWSGDDISAESLRKEMARVKRAIASGEMWEVPF